MIQQKKVERSKEQAQAESAELTRQATVQLQRQNTIKSQESVRSKKISTTEKPNAVQQLQIEESTLSTYESFDDDETYSFDQHEIAELEQKEQRRMGGILSTRKPKREMTKAERKLKKEEAAQRRITTMMAVIV